LLKEQKKMLSVVTSILKMLSDVPGLEEDDVKTIQSILRPYLDRLADCFAPQKEIVPVNGEQGPMPCGGRSTPADV
jgi:hypothetical protein